MVYGLAALDCLTGHVEDSLRRLDEALRLNAALRFQARNDSDFQNLAEDPRFTELLYPDPGADLILLTATSAKKSLSSSPGILQMEAKAAEFATPQKTARTRGLRVVAIGGGTGLSTLLKGLKRFVLRPPTYHGSVRCASDSRSFCSCYRQR